MQTTLHIDIQGQGEPLILLHGWGFHGDIWQAVSTHLAQHWQVWQVDLPGHGRSAWQPMELAGCVDLLRANLPADAVWLGWSLGGLLALLAAEQARALVLCAATPHFVQTEHWPHAMPPEVLAEFAQRLSSDHRATLQRFLALQVRGSDSASGLLRELKPRLFAHPPQPAALAAGLAWLMHGDARQHLANLNCPALLISGERDTLVPTSVADSCRALLPSLQTKCIQGAAHVPFLSHSAQFMQSLEAFLHHL